jgi:hypothetical protein
MSPGTGVTAPSYVERNLAHLQKSRERATMVRLRQKITCARSILQSGNSERIFLA